MANEVRLPPAPERVALKKWLVPILLAVAAAGVAQGFVRYTFAFVLPAMTEDVFEGSFALAGVFAAVNLGAYAAGVALVAGIATRVRSTVLVKVGMGACAAGLLLLGLGSSVALLVLGMGLCGLGGALVWVPLAGVVSSWAPPERRGLAFGLILASTGLTIALSGLLTELLQASQGPLAWREVWLAEGVLTVVVFLLVLWRLEEGEGGGAVRRPSLRALVQKVPVLRVCAMYGIWGVCYGVFANYLVAALQDVPSVSDAEAYRLYSVLGIASIVGSILIGRASDSWGRSRTMATSTGLAACSALAIAFSDDQIVVTVAVVVFGVIMTGPGVVLPAYLSDSLAPAQVAAVFGAATLSLAVAQFVAPPIGGWFADVTGAFAWTYVFAAVAAAVSAVMAGSLSIKQEAHARGSSRL